MSALPAGCLGGFHVNRVIVSLTKLQRTPPEFKVSNLSVMQVTTPLLIIFFISRLMTRNVNIANIS